LDSREEKLLAKQQVTLPLMTIKNVHTSGANNIIQGLVSVKKKSQETMLAQDPDAYLRSAQLATLLDKKDEDDIEETHAKRSEDIQKKMALMQQQRIASGLATDPRAGQKSDMKTNPNRHGDREINVKQQAKDESVTIANENMRNYIRPGNEDDARLAQMFETTAT
jgi:hypothetical protein